MSNQAKFEIMKRFFICFLIFIASNNLYAQQDPQISQNMFNLLMVNPAVAGVEDQIKVSLINRKQWVGLENSPSTLVFNIDTPIAFLGKRHGVGFTIVSDKLGIENNNSLRFSYSYQMNLKKSKFNLGVYLGIQNNALKGEWSIPKGDSRFTDPTNDPSLGSNSIDGGTMVFDSGFGAYLENEKYYIGLSATHLNEAEIKYTDNTKLTLSRHYYLTGGYNFNLTNKIELKPSFYYKTDAIVSQLDINSNLIYNKKILAGVSYRLEDAFVFMAGFKFDNGLNCGLAYDISTSRMAKGSYELMLTYRFKTKFDKKKQHYKSVRFL